MTWTTSEVDGVHAVLQNVAHLLWPDDREGKRDDLVQEAWLRLLSGPAFDPSAGIPREAFVAQRARWAMKDALRGDQVFGQARTVRGVLRLPRACVSLDTPLTPGSTMSIADTLVDPSRDPEEVAIQRASAERIASAWRRLSAVDKRTLMELDTPIATLMARHRLSEPGVISRRREARRRFYRCLVDVGVSVGTPKKAAAAQRAHAYRTARKEQQRMARHIKS